MRKVPQSAFLLPIIYLGFISLGLPDGTFGLAWPSIYRELSLPIGLAGTIMIVGTLLSGGSGFASGIAVKKLGTGLVVALSCLMTGSGLLALGAVPSAITLYLTAIPLGIGAGSVDSALNSFVARHYSGRHMNWLHACWGIGATCGPLFMGYALSSGLGWKLGYISLGSIQLTLALGFFLTLGLWSRVPERHADDHPDGGARITPTTRANSVAGVLSMAIFVIYVGIETMMGLWIGSILIVSRGASTELAAACTASYYGSITAGRIISGFIVDRMGNRLLIACGCCIALVGALIFASIAHPAAALPALILVGIGFGPIYPGMMHEVPRRFAPEAVDTVIGRQVGASYAGAASFPAIGGWIAQYALPVVPWVTLGGAALLLVAIRLLDARTRPLHNAPDPR